MTLMEQARAGTVTAEMRRVAEREGVDPEFVRRGIARGTMVIPRNRLRQKLEPVGIGEGLRVKVNASVGTSRERADIAGELEKVRVAAQAGTDTIMDLSTWGELDLVRREVLAAAPVPVGTLPVYQAVAEAIACHGTPAAMSAEGLFETVERHAADGVDFLAVHAATCRETIQRARGSGRIDHLVSYGGSYLMGWMIATGRENPFFEQYDRLLEIAREYEVTLGLADTYRPGCLADSLDRLQVAEMVILGELVQRAREGGVQVMVKGPGHVPVDEVSATVRLEKRLCAGAPYFVFGPVVTDAAPGYDHITSAIGGAIAGASGADFICYVTPAEHLGYPTAVDVREGVMAARIAARWGDLARGLGDGKSAK